MGARSSEIDADADADDQRSCGCADAPEETAAGERANATHPPSALAASWMAARILT
jgi:hypothetical protein